MTMFLTFRDWIVFEFTGLVKFPNHFMRFAISTVLVLFCSHADSQEYSKCRPFILHGAISGIDSGIVTLSYINCIGVQKIDTQHLKRGVFDFKGNVSEPTWAMLRGSVSSSAIDEPNATRIIIEPRKMTISLKNNEFKNSEITGSKTQTEYDLLNSKLKSISRQEDSLVKKIKYFSDLPTLDSVSKTHILSKLEMDRDSIIDMKLSVYVDFISSHPNSYLSSYFLFYLINSRFRYPAKNARILFSRLNPNIKKSSYGKEIEKRLASTENYPAAQFIATDINGNTVNLSSFKGRYVLLDFWASWCIPCRKNTPHLLKIYSQYHQFGLDVIAIANDDKSKDAWSKAIRDDKTGVFYHILQGVGSKNDIGKKYGIYPIPVKILIDQAGFVILRIEGDNDDLLDKKLIEVFQ